MGDLIELNCPYCDKKYKNQGFLPKHIDKQHEDDLLLDRNMTVLHNVAEDESCLAAGLNLSENPFWDIPENQATSTLTSTPTPAHSSFSTAVLLGEMYPFGPVQLK